MASLADIIRDKITRIETIPEAFSDSVTASQSDLFKILLDLLDKLELDGGNLVFNSNNLSTVNSILDEYKLLVSASDYTKAVAGFAEQFGKQAALNDQMLRATFDDFTRSDLLTQLLRQRTTGAMQQLIGGALDPVFFDPVKKELIDAVAGGGGFTDLVKTIQDVVLGDSQRLGRLDSYSRQISSDLFAITDRTYTKSAGDELGAVWYRYIGGLIEDSRAFCMDRNDRFYHKSEVEAWGAGQVSKGITNPTAGSQPWQGMITPTTPTNIFNNLGGYQCKHSIAPVSIAGVPKDVVARNISSGNFEPSEFEREQLGL